MDYLESGWSDQARVIAPAVNNRLQAFVRDDQTALREVILLLTPMQLRGGAALPELLPFVSAMRADVTTESFTTVERRLVLTAALDVTARPQLVLEASAVDSAVLLLGPVRRHLVVTDGRIRFTDERLRSLVVQESKPSEIALTYAALSRAARRAEERDVSLLYLVRAGDAEQRRSLVPQLVQAAGVHLKKGFSRNAYALASSVSMLPGEGARHALSIMARAAFWNGHFDEAESLLTPRVARGPLGLMPHDQRYLELIARMRQGPPTDLAPRRRGLVVMDWLREAAESRVDRRALSTSIRAAQHWYDGEAEDADSLCAQMFLAMGPIPPDRRWDTGPEMITPLVRAQLCVKGAALQIHVSEVEDAARYLLEGSRSLPLEHAAAGLTPMLLRSLQEAGFHEPSGIVGTYDRLIGRVSTRWTPDGPPIGQRTVAALRAITSHIPLESDTSGGFSGTPHLSRRQRDVHRLLARGYSNRQIGDTLGITERTVEVHVTAVFRRIGVHSRVELLASLARRPGAR